MKNFSFYYYLEFIGGQNWNLGFSTLAGNAIPRAVSGQLPMAVTGV
jgi:hypothetical protein